MASSFTGATIGGLVGLGFIVLTGATVTIPIIATTALIGGAVFCIGHLAIKLGLELANSFDSTCNNTVPQQIIAPVHNNMNRKEKVKLKEKTKKTPTGKELTNAFNLSLKILKQKHSQEGEYKIKRQNKKGLIQVDGGTIALSLIIKQLKELGVSIDEKKGDQLFNIRFDQLIKFHRIKKILLRDRNLFVQNHICHSMRFDLRPERVIVGSDDGLVMIFESEERYRCFLNTFSDQVKRDKAVKGVLRDQSVDKPAIKFPDYRSLMK